MGSGGGPRPSGGMSAGGLTMSVRKLSGGSGVGPPGLPGTVGGASKETFSKDDRRRFEFVVMLVWREPVPKIEPNAEYLERPVSSARESTDSCASLALDGHYWNEAERSDTREPGYRDEEQRSTQEASLLDSLRARAAVRPDRGPHDQFERWRRGREEEQGDRGRERGSREQEQSRNRTLCSA